jgi:hypothetical protein
MMAPFKIGQPLRGGEYSASDGELQGICCVALTRVAAVADRRYSFNQTICCNLQ